MNTALDLVSRFVDKTRGPLVDRRRILGWTAGGGAALTAGTLNLGRTAMAADEAPPSVYRLEGRLLEVCTCNVLCPCWVGEDPDGGTCDAIAAWHVDKGTINGLDVAGHTIAVATFIQGNILKGDWRTLLIVDDETSPEQQDALVQVWTGKLGGPVADLAGLFGEVLGVERAPVTFTVEGGQGTLTIGTVVEAKLAPFQGATGTATTLVDTVFSTIPGAPAYVGKAELFRRHDIGHGLANVDLSGHNAIQGLFRFEV